jgi:hypothetical protein
VWPTTCLWRFSPHSPPPICTRPSLFIRMIDWGPLLQAGHAKKILFQHSLLLISTKIASSQALHCSDQARSLGPFGREFALSCFSGRDKRAVVAFRNALEKID